MSLVAGRKCNARPRKIQKIRTKLCDWLGKSTVFIDRCFVIASISYANPVTVSEDCVDGCPRLTLTKRIIWFFFSLEYQEVQEIATSDLKRVVCRLGQACVKLWAVLHPRKAT
ncbi:uncharacterized protein N7511_001462 [Penicillium nucicola]|uniref:uncharacterized protein n=1 Tax=Penicillium nucicola TaxID=1850975 RepID=UPI002545855D|nr:uncharacterized protein N7511_001462 [Penicillium nucicola]KAJ5776451.1 hypothetical protein N7511_001462 [Penicillium nucicola]